MVRGVFAAAGRDHPPNGLTIVDWPAGEASKRRASHLRGAGFWERTPSSASRRQEPHVQRATTCTATDPPKPDWAFFEPQPGLDPTAFSTGGPADFRLDRRLGGGWSTKLLA